jgi:hypothetical protein
VVESILGSIKQMLGIEAEDINFDQELIIYINGALMIMKQLGVGTSGYTITDNTSTWKNFIGTRTDLELIKPAVYLRVRLIFDPPQNSFLVAAIKEQIAEYDWRIEWDHIPEVITEVIDGK